MIDLKYAGQGRGESKDKSSPTHLDCAQPEHVPLVTHEMGMIVQMIVQKVPDNVSLPSSIKTERRKGKHARVYVSPTSALSSFCLPNQWLPILINHSDQPTAFIDIHRDEFDALISSEPDRSFPDISIPITTPRGPHKYTILMQTRVCTLLLRCVGESWKQPSWAGQISMFPRLFGLPGQEHFLGDNHASL